MSKDVEKTRKSGLNKQQTIVNKKNNDKQLQNKPQNPNSSTVPFACAREKTSSHAGKN